MTNWKLYMSMASFMIAGIELLNIKDHYNPEKITSILIYSFVAFMLTIGVALALLISAFKKKQQRS